MAEDKKKLSAKEVVADIRAGAADEFLMKKYGISDKGWQSLFQKLIAAKVLSQADLDRRASVVEEVEIIEDISSPPAPNREPLKKDSFVTRPTKTDPSPVVENQDQEAIVNIITQFKAEMAQGTEKRVLRKFLTKNGWEKDEAKRFVNQIAEEVSTNPDEVKAVLKRYKRYMFWGGLATLLGVIMLLAGGEIGKFAFFGSIALVWGFVGWLFYRKRLTSDQPIINKAVNFRPTQGNLVLKPVRVLSMAGWLVIFSPLIAILIIKLLIMIDSFVAKGHF